MELPLTRDALPLLRWVDETPSTNALLRELLETVPGGEDRALPHGALVATANQTEGRGRAGRGWETPPGTAVAASMLLRLDGPASGVAGASTAPGPIGGVGLGLSWLPLLAGSAVVTALQPLFRGDDELDALVGIEPGETKRVGVKWPNDVHVRDEAQAMAGVPGAKLCGILCEALPGGAVIVGFGVNLLQEQWQLPTDRAGSVLASGGRTSGAHTLADARGEALADRVLSSTAVELLRLVELARDDPEAARRRVRRDSLTIGAEVRVHLPGGEIVDGRAVGLDENGALIVDRPTSGRLIVSAADVEHLR